MPIGRGERFDTRQRREFQRFAEGLGLVFGDGLDFDEDTGLISIDIFPDTGGILTFTGLGELTTQYVTTSGGLGTVSVDITADDDVNITPTGDFVFTNGGGASLRTIGGGVFAFNDAVTGGFQFDDGSGHGFFGPAGNFDLNGPLAIFSANDVDINIFAGFTTGTGGNITMRGGDASGVNISGGLVALAGGIPTGTGNSIVNIIVFAAGGAARQRIKADINGLGFFGATPIAQPGTYTITAAPAVATALNADGNAGAAYTGLATGLGATPYAAVADLNDLRTDVVSLAAVLRQLIKHLGDTGGLGLVNETAY